ncbi:uncharacterized protein LOC127749403 [Frankliniella occidentalis]|uniref:Uncharacterized protein LOC127749403 n=1 Tax=Frankliniella occidentalis TaxID=133901 RepID=A0A9C6WZR4_FRAOC|nr:uncharacterized protein LOC127749403 [Frankliniella occidentalis]
MIVTYFSLLTGVPRHADDYTAVNPRKILGLPQEYAVVPLTSFNVKQGRCPTSDVSRLDSLSADPMLEEHAWLEACGRAETSNTWAGFHSRRSPEVEHLARFAVLPPFNNLAHTVEMMAHSIRVAIKATKLLNPDQLAVLGGDLPLFALLKEIQYTCPEIYGEDKIFIMMGGMHIEKAAYTLLGDILDGSGWSAALVESKVTTKGRADSMLTASHITRTRYVHQVTAAAFYSLKWKAYAEYAGDDPLSFEDWCHSKQKTPQFRFCDIVLNLILAILQLVRATRTANIELYIQALTRIVPFFFALDHQNYARWLPIHLRDLINLEKHHPELWNAFQKGYFVAAKSSRRFSTISLDQAHEQLNATLKGNGGVVGLTDSPSALLNWILFAPEIADIVDKFEQNTFNFDPDSDAHHFDTESARSNFLRDKTALEEYFENTGNPFAEEGINLYNFDTRRCASADVVDTFLNLEAKGNEQYLKYTQERLVTGEVSIHAPIKQNKFPTFAKNMRPANKNQNQKEQIKALKDESELFGKLFVAISRGRPSDLNLFFSHENTDIPPSLFLNDGSMRPPKNNSDLVNDCLVPLQTCSLYNRPKVTAKILDGGFIAHLLKPGVTVTFSEFREKVFLPFIVQEASSVSRLDVVWDTYIEHSLKDTTREKRGEGPRTLVTPETKLPKNWPDFLRNAGNKTDFFALLARSIPDCKIMCQLYSTFGEAVVSNCEQSDVSFISPCNHEEADTRMLLHVADAVRSGHKEIIIRSTDTDVVVLAVACVEMLPGLEELWVHIGSGKNHRYIAAHEISKSLKLKLGPKMPQALPAFHALTGCDTVSAFNKIGKKGAWSALTLHPQTVDALIDLAEGNIAAAKRKLFRFVIAMFSSAQYQSLAEARRALYCSTKRSMDTIPPTEDVTLLHFLRASYCAQVWSQLTVRTQALPSPSDWGFSLKEDGWKPVHRSQPTATEACKDIIVKCGCKSACQGNCSCSKRQQKCTDLCACTCNKADSES